MKRYVAASLIVVLAAAIGASTSVGASVARKTTKAEKALIKHVPSPTNSTCKGATAQIKKMLNKDLPKNRAHTKNIVAGLKCTPDGVSVVFYVQFTKASDMNATYDQNLAFYNLQSDTAPPSEGTCPIESGFGKSAGRVACVPSTANRSISDIVWTEKKLKILSEALVLDDPDGSKAFTFFSSVASGPK